MKKILFLMILIMFPIVVNASSFNTSISSKTNIEPQEQFTITINVSNTNNLFGLTANLNYDKSKLSLVSSNGLNGYTITVGNNIVLDSSSSKSGSFSIATLTFKASSSFSIGQSTNISLTNVNGSDGLTDFSGSNSLININVVSPKSSNNNLSNIRINNKNLNNFSPNILNYNINVSNEVNLINIFAVAQDNKARISGLGNKNLTVGLNVFNVVVTAENGNRKTYTLRITRQEEHVISSNSFLSDLVIENFEIEFDREVFKYNLVVDESVKKLDITPVLDDDRSKVKIENNDLNIGNNKIVIKVTAEDESISEYIINVEKTEGIITTLSDFNIYESDKVTIQIVDDNFIIDSEKLKLLKDKNLTVNIYKENRYLYSWFFENMNISNELNTKIEFYSEDYYYIQQLSNYADFILLNFKNQNELPENTKVKIFIGDKYLDEDLLNLYFFDTNKLKLVERNLKVEEGFVYIDLKHTSQYILTKSNIINTNKYLYIIILQCIIITLLVIINFLRRKNEK